MIDILVVEPDRVLAATYQAALGGAGYSVAVQTSAQAAVHSVDVQNPRLIITELQLAEHNGVEFLYELRSYPDWQNIPVIVLTSVPPAETRLRSTVQRELGIVRYCYKPHTRLERLVQTAQEILAAQGAAAA